MHWRMALHTIGYLFFSFKPLCTSRVCCRVRFACRGGRRTRRWQLPIDLRTRSSFSPPSHSLLFVGRTRRITQYTASGMRRIKTNSALPDRCFGRFRCVKNNTQLFLTCYILAAMPTQLSLCAISVSSKSCATGKSSFVAASDLPARNIGSCISSFIISKYFTFYLYHCVNHTIP